MKKVIVLLMLSFTTTSLFSQSFDLVEIIKKETNSSTIGSIQEASDSKIKSVSLNISSDSVIINLLGKNGKTYILDVLKVEGVSSNDLTSKIIKGKGNYGDFITVSLNNNGTLFIDYGISYDVNDIYASMFFE